jgi:hypothetical protein
MLAREAMQTASPTRLHPSPQYRVGAAPARERRETPCPPAMVSELSPNDIIRHAGVASRILNEL